MINIMLIILLNTITTLSDFEDKYFLKTVEFFKMYVNFSVV